jgi:two-component system catabolic regulation response regulator CreB
MPQSILIVEDEPAIADAVAFTLQQDGFTTCHVTTLAAARAELERALPTLMVLDVGLPDGSGFDLARVWAQRVPLLFLTARASEIDRVVGLELGADDYLTKPFSPRELVARVRAILRRCHGARSAATPAHTTSTARLTIDTTRLQARWDGQTLDLPRLQFRILCILAQHPGKVWSRSALMDAAWEQPEEAFDRAVDSQIRHLRASLALVAPGIDLIRTVCGEGYALAEGYTHIGPPL